MSIPFISAEEAASVIKNGDNVGLSGFTASGTPKVVTVALAEKAKALHEKGEPFKINLFTGASTNDHVDGELSRADAIGMRVPYQSHKDCRKLVNGDGIHYSDLHLSHLSQDLRYGFYGDIDVAVIEATEMSPNGEVILGAGLGMAPTVAQMAKKVIIEYSSYYHNSFRGFHDNYIPLDPPHRREIPIYKPNDRIGSPILKIDPKKIIGVVPSNASESIAPFTAPDELTSRIGQNICDFLAAELRNGKIPKEFLPIQSGVGNVANAVLYGLGENPEIPRFEMYTEVIQDAVMKLMEEGKCKFASTCALTLHTRTRHQDDERYRRFGRLQPQRISFYFLLSFNPEGGQDLDFRADGVASRPQRTFSQDPRHRTGRGRSPRQRPASACGNNHRELRSSDVQGTDVGLSEACLQVRRSHSASSSRRFRSSRGIHGDRRHA